ncbi:MAG: DUF7122 family protein [Halodesulfurarchaeum sp.]
MTEQDPKPQDDRRENRSDAFERVPKTEADRVLEGRPSRAAIVEYFADRFGIAPRTFDGVSFWEKGAGRIWALSHELPGPVQVEALGLPVLRTRQEFWKPTTDAALRFGGRARRNVIELGPNTAERFLAGETIEIEWDGEWGYLIGAHQIAGDRESIGVGLYTYGELKSMVPKGRRRKR